MIIIRNGKPKEGKKTFRVITTAENSEILKTSETLTSKQKCFVNILSDAKNYSGCTGAFVRDETAKKHLEVRYTIDELRKKAGKKEK